jgi:hypothetical protein
MTTDHDIGGLPWTGEWEEAAWADAKYEGNVAVPGTSRLYKALTSNIPAMISPDGHALASFVYQEGAGDSFDREMAFTWATEVHGWDYDQLYVSWLRGEN